MPGGGPTLEFDWEMGIFRALRALWRSVSPQKRTPWDDDRVVRLAELEERLRWLAGMVGGRPLRVLPARHGGGVRGSDLLLPAWLDLGPDAEVNTGLYILRVAVDASTAAWSLPVPPDPVDAWVLSLRSAACSVASLREELGAFGDAWDEAAALVRSTRPEPSTLAARSALAEAAIHQVLTSGTIADDLSNRLRALPDRGGWPAPVPLWGRLIPVVGGALDGAGDVDDTGPPGRDASEHEAPPMEDLEIVSLQTDRPTEMPIHSFEKVELAEAFNGTLRQLDGEDELDQHMESLSEVDLGHLVRGGPEAHSVLRADIAMNAQIPDVGRIGADEVGVPYDEWDGRAGAWRKDWCHVYPTPLPAGGLDSEVAADMHRLRRTVERLYDQLIIHRSERSTVGRQLDGEDLDMDAIVDAHATVRAQRTPSQRLYLRRPRQRRDVATTVLLDVSLSADAWIDNRRVLDVARDAVMVLGEVADRLGDRLQVLAFASSTRNRVRVFTVRDWDEPWAVGARRLRRLEPQGYTRLGAALRHATDRLCDADARERLLLLISDGKPTDWDRYEGRYGVMDVRMALRQARARGVSAHALAVDTTARDHLPEMLGPGHWDILPHPEALVEALTRVYGRLS
jgi:nitric oxide reductase NorD protein